MALWSYTYESSQGVLVIDFSIHRQLTSAIEFRPEALELTDCAGQTRAPAFTSAIDPSIYRYGQAQLVEFRYQMPAGTDACRLSYAADGQAIEFIFSG